MAKHAPMLLCILDGFGLSEKTEGNAIKSATTPYIDKLFEQHPSGQLFTHGAYVGLPDGQMGNSEVGHMTIGSGRIILQSLDRIRHRFETGAIKQTPTWKKLEQASSESRALHVFALISNGGVHSHTDHIIKLCKNLNAFGKPVFVHAITDGRDTAPYCAKEQMDVFMAGINHLENVHLATLGGRFYAMDRDGRWERVQRAYETFTAPQPNLHSPIKTYAEIIEEAHKAEQTDEFIEPTAFAVEGLDAAVKDEDTLVFANFRADRMRQLARSFMEDVPELDCPHVRAKNLFSMTEYDKNYNDFIHVLFPPEYPEHTLGEVVTKAGGKQLRIAESEKYAHVTFFLNGGREQPFEKEDRIVVSSPKVKTYDLAPAMSLPEVTEKLIGALNTTNYDLVVLNIANGDQVGHSGSFDACVKAVEAIDAALAKIIPVLTAQGGEAVIIADHGNCEELLDAEGNMMTSHTLNPVPLLYIGRSGATVKNGGLADVAPTLLSLMNLTIPEEMTGDVLIQIPQQKA